MLRTVQVSQGRGQIQQVWLEHRKRGCTDFLSDLPWFDPSDELPIEY